MFTGIVPLPLRRTMDPNIPQIKSHRHGSDEEFASDGYLEDEKRSQCLEIRNRHLTENLSAKCVTCFSV